MIKRNPWPCGAVLGVCLVCTLGISQDLRAQQPEQSPLPAPTQTKSANDLGAAESQPTADSNVPKDDRILWTLPNYLTVENASSMPALTATQKFMLIAKDTFDPITFTFIGLEAGLNQAGNTNPTFGQGFRGYSKRYGLAFTDNAVGNFMTSAVFPVALHQDPRFYQMGTGGFLHRAWYAGTRVLVTRSDSGKAQINFSEILGNGVAAAMSNAYHPGPRTLSSNINIWGTQIAWDAVSYEMKEFWPDVRRFLVRHRSKM
ncbi:MAG: hypothetical protein ACLQVL_11325 [Terriglobia bacterium]